MQLHHINTCLDEVVKCAIECESCSTHCIDDGNRSECTKECISCARACWETAGTLARNSPYVHQYCGHCAAICDSCAIECAKFANEHCQNCAEECRRCAQCCREMAHVLAPV